MLLLLFNAKSIKGFVCVCANCVRTERQTQLMMLRADHSIRSWPRSGFLVLISTILPYPILPEQQQQQAPAQLSAVYLCATCLKRRLIRRAARRSQFERALDVTTSSSGSLSQFDRHTDVFVSRHDSAITIYKYTIHYATNIVIRISIESSWFHSYIWCVLFELAAPFDELLAGCFALVLAPGHWCRLSVQFPLWEKRKIIIIIRDD